jgi:hypothetical protein
VSLAAVSATDWRLSLVTTSVSVAVVLSVIVGLLGQGTVRTGGRSGHRPG